MSNGNGIIAKVQTVLLSPLIQEQLLLLMLLYECVSSNLSNKKGPRAGCCADPRCQKGLSALKFTKHEQCNKTEGERTFAKTVSERTKRWHFCTATPHFTNTSTPMLIPNSFLSSPPTSLCFTSMNDSQTLILRVGGRSPWRVAVVLGCVAYFIPSSLHMLLGVWKKHPSVTRRSGIASLTPIAIMNVRFW